MKKDIKELYNKLSFRLKDLNDLGKIKELIDSDLIDEYLNKGMQTKILTLNLPFEALTIYELFHITRLVNLYEIKIDVEEYFTDTEITNAMQNKNNLKLEVNQIIAFENVLQIKNNNDEYWVCSITLKQIYELMKMGVLGYNLDSQRAGILKKYKNETMVIPDINEKNVQEIKRDMINKKFLSNMISFNILPEYNYKLEYNSINKNLLVNTNIFSIDIIDGMHRIMGCVRAIEENPDLQGELLLKITSMSLERARMFIIQESKGNVQNKEHLEKYNPENKITMFINNINKKGSEKTNILYDKIDMGTNTPFIWIPFELFKRGLILSGFMDDISNTDNKKNLEKIEEFIIDWFTKFYEIAKDNNIKICKNETFTDSTFVMMLLITCHKYIATRKIDTEAMCSFMKKFKTTDTKYTLKFPIKNRQETIMAKKFEKLLEV